MGFITHIGTFLLFAASILLLITTISAPVVNNISLLKVELQNKDVVTFGTFGYCTSPSGGGSDVCTEVKIGYSPVKVLEAATNEEFSAEGVTRVLTSIMILHPIACGLAFLAFLTALGSSIIGALVASILSFLAWIVALVVVVTDFVSFGIIKNKVNGSDSNISARFDTAIWTALAGMILLFLAMFLVLFTCCSNRRSKRRDTRAMNTKSDPGYMTGAAQTNKRHFWQRR